MPAHSNAPALSVLDWPDLDDKQIAPPDGRGDWAKNEQSEGVEIPTIETLTAQLNRGDVQDAAAGGTAASSAPQATASLSSRPCRAA
eukprot:472979-Pyramimonas_sp.AAC.1